MKIAYLSVYRDQTGYADAALGNMLAAESVGIDVVGRPIFMSPIKDANAPCEVEHLEKKDTDGVDAVIQHCLPHTYEYRAGVRNIGYVDWETTHFLRSNWEQCCNLMDEMWVPCLQNKWALINSGVTKPIHIVPHARDLARYSDDVEPLDLPGLKNKCVFYVIGEMGRRKNFSGLVRGFFKAFSSRDDVILVIKTNAPGKTADETTQMVKGMIGDVKKSMHSYFRHDYYPKVAVITDFLTEHQLGRLHRSCDVFVLPTRGDAWAIPVHDAMGFGNPAIVSNWGGLPDLVMGQSEYRWNPHKNLFNTPGEIESGWLIDGQLTSCFGVTESFPDLYTGEELWFEPDLEQLSAYMRQAYGMWQEGSLSTKSNAAVERAKEFSYGKVGNIIKEVLES